MPASATEPVEPVTASTETDSNDPDSTVAATEPTSVTGLYISNTCGVLLAVVHVGIDTSAHDGLFIHPMTGARDAVMHPGTVDSMKPIPNAATVLPVAIHAGTTVSIH